jgi:hypothetical protein
MRQRARFQPRLDNLERRELMATGLATAGPAVAEIAEPHTPRTAAAAAAATQAVVQIKNLTSAPVTYTFRWSRMLQGSTTTLAPGATKIYWADYVDGLTAEVRFDRSTMPGAQDKFVSLAYAKYTGGGTPPASVAKTYAFQAIPGGIDLTDKVTTRAVVGFRNNTNTTVILQFRWNNTASWSPTIKLAPGKTQHFWISSLNISRPEVRYDRSPQPGWQLQTYGLGFNTVTGTSNPPFSSARAYTFLRVNGGVGLFG